MINSAETSFHITQLFTHTELSLSYFHYFAWAGDFVCVICRVSHILSHSMQIILCWLWSIFVQYASLCTHTHTHHYSWLLRGEWDQEMLHARLESVAPAMSILSTSMLLRLTYVGVFEQTADPGLSLQLLMIWGLDTERTIYSALVLTKVAFKC